MVDALIIILLVLVLGALIALGVLLYRRNKAARAKPQSAPANPDPFAATDVDALRGDPRTLAPGGIVDIRGEPYTVRGSLHLDEDGWTWAEHFLDNAKGRRMWLSVEEDPELELVLFTGLPDADVSPGKVIELEGRTYRHTESGTARFRAEGTTGLAAEGTVRYQDYRAGEDSRLALESYTGDKWEVSRGEVLSRYEVRIYPPSDA